MKRDSFSTKGYRLNLNRFMAVITEGEKFLRSWPIDEWERTFLSLEKDFLAGKGIKKVFLKAGEAETVGDGGGSTSSARVTLEDRSLRQCMQNAMTISVMFLQDSTNKRRLAIICVMGNSEAPGKARAPSS